MRSEHPSSPIDSEAPVYQAIRAHNNIDLKIEAIPGGDFNAKVQLLLGTAQLPDIMRLTQRQVNDFADAGVFLPLNDPVQTQAPGAVEEDRGGARRAGRPSSTAPCTTCRNSTRSSS